MAYREDLYIHTVNQLRSGKTAAELSEKLNTVVRACRDTQKVGEITLRLKVKPDKGDTGQYFIEDTVTAKTPEFERGKTIMWGTPEGNLQRTDPNQGELELRTVPDDAQQPRVVPNH